MDKHSEIIQIPEKVKASNYNYPSPYLFTLAPTALLILGAVTLRLDFFILGLIPFLIMSWVILVEYRINSLFKKSPLKGMAYPPLVSIAAGKEFTVRIDLLNSTPRSIGKIRIETRTCSGIRKRDPFIIKLNKNSKTSMNITLVPVRSGNIFFYGLSIIISAPFGFRPRRFYLVLPMCLNVSPENLDPVFTKKLEKIPVYEKFPQPTHNGDLAELRLYQTGDPRKAIVRTASLKRQKPVIRLSYPEKKGKWQILFDTTPSVFRGRPGESPFDYYVSVLPQIIKKLQKMEHEVGITVFRKEIEVILNRIKVNKLIYTLAEYRYKTLELCENVDQLNILNLLRYLNYNFGTGIYPPESTTPNQMDNFKKTMIAAYNSLAAPRGIEKLLVSHSEPIQEILTKISILTGYEPPVLDNYQSGLGKALDDALKKYSQHIIIFSELEPVPAPGDIIPRLRIALKRNLKVFFLILDDSPETDKTLKRSIVEKEAHYRWKGLIKEIRSAGANVIFWSPESFDNLLNLFKG
ncbi:MAG: DUF58 domain-containing protein [Deltaproteobacteria bacterium]|nr:DUF58 domain-containing protein [Deltaproteobacteria bacterium]